MSFQSGLIGFSRFLVHGDAPTTCDDTLLSILKEYAFKECTIGVPSEVEAGFIAGRHLFDTRFDYEQNGYGSQVLFAIRLDSHKVPSEIRHAYKQMNEQAAAEAGATGFASKKEKREASELASRQVHEDMAAGKFRRSKSVPLLWDLAGGVLYCGSSSGQAIEQVTRLLHESLNVDLELISAGRLAGSILRGVGRGRDYEDVRPSPLTRPPARAIAAHDDAEASARDVTVPAVPWSSQSLDLKDFLGNEFLVWLWHESEQASGVITCSYDEHMKTVSPMDYFITFDKALDMDCAWGVGGKQSLRGDGPMAMREAGEALVCGKWPRKAGLILSDGEYQWQVILQADRMVVSSLKLPAVEDTQSPRELIEMRIELVRAFTRAIDRLYAQFLSIRLSSSWPGKQRTISSWIRSRMSPREKSSAEQSRPKLEPVSV